jgi:hypothetical protein
MRCWTTVAARVSAGRAFVDLPCIVLLALDSSPNQCHHAKKGAAPLANMTTARSSVHPPKMEALVDAALESLLCDKTPFVGWITISNGSDLWI